MAQDIPLRIACDFDGVCHDPTNVPKGYKLGQPIKGAQKALQGLKEQGAIIVIHTVWADTEARCEAISKWMRYFNIPYDFITNQKPVADAYLDNLGIRFSDWEQALLDIKKYTKK